MTSYRISKYNPANRDSNGSYLDDSEWTAISHIGKKEYNYLTYNEYKEVEDAYVEAVKVILGDKEIDFLKVNSIEFYSEKADFTEYNETGILKDLTVCFEDLQGLRNGTKVALDELPELIRLILREIIWMYLTNGKVKIYAGYDYYLYARCGKLKRSSIEQIEQSGLFVEKIT